MCNRFSGEGKLSNGELTAKGLAMTRMMCANPQLNELDNTISEMLKEGAQVDLTANNMVKINYPHNNRRRGGYIYGSAIATPLIFYSPFSALFLTPRKIYLLRALSR